MQWTGAQPLPSKVFAEAAAYSCFQFALSVFELLQQTPLPDITETLVHTPEAANF